MNRIFGALHGDDELEAEEIREIMVQVAHYASWAAGTLGTDVLREVLKRPADSYGV